MHRWFPLPLLALLASSCSLIQAPPPVGVIQVATPSPSAIQGPATPTHTSPIPSPHCTLPPCEEGQLAFRATDCPNGCGVACATFTPLPGPLYPSAEMLGISFPSGRLQVSFKVPGITGHYFAMIGDTEYSCGFAFPDTHPERLYCIGPAQPADSILSMAVYRLPDSALAFAVTFVVPPSQRTEPPKDHSTAVPRPCEPWPDCLGNGGTPEG